MVNLHFALLSGNLKTVRYLFNKLVVLRLDYQMSTRYGKFTFF